eukprot:3936173-Rhodomonas_salina.1
MCGTELAYGAMELSGLMLCSICHHARRRTDTHRHADTQTYRHLDTQTQTQQNECMCLREREREREREYMLLRDVLYKHSMVLWTV